MLFRMQLFLHVLSSTTTRVAPLRAPSQRFLHATRLTAIRAQLPDVLVIAGPTAVGKSNVALELCRQYNGEIVSADSVHVYRGMDICSNKATAAELKEVPHHLINILDPNDYFTAGQFVRRATTAINDIRSRGKLPVVVGGNTMWLKWLIHGTPDAPASSMEERKEIDNELNELEVQGKWHEAIQILAKLAPNFAETIVENDWYRLKRLLAIARTGTTELSNTRTPELPLDWDVRCFFLAEERVHLYKRIDRRCEQLILQGSIKEVADLITSGKMGPHSMGAKAIGYRQIIDYLVRENFAPQDWNSFSAMMLSFMGATRRYAKRQYTWYRREPAFLFVNALSRPSRNYPGQRDIDTARSIEGVLRWSRVNREQYLKETAAQYEVATVDGQNATSGHGTHKFSKLTSVANRTISHDQRLYEYQPRLTLLSSVDAQSDILAEADRAYAQVHKHPDIVEAFRACRPPLTRPSPSFHRDNKAP